MSGPDGIQLRKAVAVMPIFAAFHGQAGITALLFLLLLSLPFVPGVVSGFGAGQPVRAIRAGSSLRGGR